MNAHELRQVLAVAERRHGLVTFDDFEREGFEREAARLLVRRGVLDRCQPGVFRVAGSEATWRQRVLARVLSGGPDSVACRTTAAALYRLPGYDEERIDVLRPRASSHHGRARWMHESTFLPPSHRTVIDGIPTTSIERTLFDLAGAVHLGRADRAVDNALLAKLTTLGRLQTVLAETAARRRPGSRALRAILAVRTEGYVPPTTELERVLFAVLEGAGHVPRRQVWTGATAAPIGRVDALLDGSRLVIEADSERWHSSWRRQESDHRRDQALLAAGYQVVRTNWNQLTKEPGLLLAAVRGATARLHALRDDSAQ